MRLKKDKMSEPCCENCGNCLNAGEGDYICEAGTEKLVISDFVFTDDYFWCSGKEYIRQGGYKE